MFSPSLLHQHINHAKELGYTEDGMYIKLSTTASNYILKSVSFVTEQNPQGIKTFFGIPCETNALLGIDNQFILMLYHTHAGCLFGYIGNEKFYQ